MCNEVGRQVTGAKGFGVQLTNTGISVCSSNGVICVCGPHVAQGLRVRTNTVYPAELAIQFVAKGFWCCGCSMAHKWEVRIWSAGEGILVSEGKCVWWWWWWGGG